MKLYFLASPNLHFFTLASLKRKFGETNLRFAYFNYVDPSDSLYQDKRKFSEAKESKKALWETITYQYFAFKVLYANPYKFIYPDFKL